MFLLYSPLKSSRGLSLEAESESCCWTSSSFPVSVFLTSASSSLLVTVFLTSASSSFLVTVFLTSASSSFLVILVVVSSASSPFQGGRETGRFLTRNARGMMIRQELLQCSCPSLDSGLILLPKFGENVQGKKTPALTPRREQTPLLILFFNF